MQTLDFTRPGTPPPTSHPDTSTSSTGIQPGAICTHRYNAGGLCLVTFPYWQVRARHPHATRRLWTCSAVPASVYPNQTVVWEEDDLVPTGLTAPVISHQDLELCMQKEWHMNGFIANLNFKPDGTHFTFDRNVARIARTVRRGPDRRGFIVTLPLLSVETDLIRLLGDRPWQFGAYPQQRYTQPETT